MASQSNHPIVSTALMLGIGLLAGMPALAKDSISLGMVLEPPHLDPTAGAAAAIDEIVYANLFEGLTRIDRNGVVQPSLAKSWTVSDDGLVYTFALEDGISFHDGSRFDAEDVVFSLERAMAEESVNAQKSLFEPIKSVAANGASEVAITLKRTDRSFPLQSRLGRCRDRRA